MAETKSGEWSVQWHGPQYAASGTMFIAQPTGGEYRKPRLYATLSCSVTRSSKESSKLQVTVSGYHWPLTGGNTGQNAAYGYTYGYEITLSMTVGGVTKQVFHKDNSPSKWTTYKDGETHTFEIDWPSNSVLPITLNCYGGCAYYDNCTPGGNFSYTIANLAVPNYDPTPPWSDPINASNVRNSVTTLKPDGSMSVSWSAARAGTGNSITKYAVDMQRYRNGAWSSNVAINNSIGTGTTSLSFRPGDYINLRPGDQLRFSVNTYMTSSTSGYSSGWLGSIYASNNNVSIYKDGIVYNIDANGTKRECTMAYYYDSNGTKRKSRYIVVKDSGGATRIIDMYTTNYE